MDQPITLIHITSSIHYADILEQGLIPHQFFIEDVEKYIQQLLPNQNAFALTEEIIKNERKCSDIEMLKVRLSQAEPRLSFMPEKSEVYYNSILKRVQDGGEFYSIIRKALETITNTKISPLHPGAYPIICKAVFNTYLGKDGWPYLDIPEQKVRASHAIEHDFIFTKPLKSSMFTIQHILNPSCLQKT